MAANLIGDPVVPPGYKLVKVPMNGGTVPILVQQRGDALAHSSPPNAGTFHNASSVFSETNAMANKKFSYDTGAFAKRSSDSQAGFVTKSYEDSAVGRDHHIDTASARLPTSADFNRSAGGFDRSYAVASADNRGSFAGVTTSALQNRSAATGGSSPDVNHEWNGGAHKQYLGPGAQYVPVADHISDNVVLSRMSGLPNRPLSIDEVRDLINHGVQVDTEIKPETSSKPLNDPDYQPQPLRAQPAVPARPSDEDKDDPVPSPGTIASPENAEPLPQR